MRWNEIGKVDFISGLNLWSWSRGLSVANNLAEYQVGFSEESLWFRVWTIQIVAKAFDLKKKQNPRVGLLPLKYLGDNGFSPKEFRQNSIDFNEILMYLAFSGLGLSL